MASFDINTGKLKTDSQDVGSTIHTLKAIETEINNIVNSLRIDSEAGNAIKLKLKKKIESVGTAREKVRVLSATLNEIAALYETTEKNVKSNNSSIRKKIESVSETIRKTEKALGMDASSTYSSDPVNLCNGNYVYEKTFLQIDSIIPMNFHVFYNSQNRNTGVLGKGWMHDYEVNLRMEENTARIQKEDAVELIFYRDKHGAFYSLNGTFGKLEQTADEYQLSDSKQMRWIFNGNGKLLRKMDLGGNTVTMYYGEDGQLEKAEDNFGNSLYFSYDQDKRLCKVVDHADRTLSLEYADNNLSHVVDAEGNSIGYQYDKNGYLSTIINGNGIAGLQNEYDDEGRTISQKFPDGGTMTYQYDDENKKIILTEQNGNKIQYVHDQYMRNVCNIYIDGEERFQYNKHNQRIAFTDKRGHTSRYIYDDLGRLITFCNARGDKLSLNYTDYDQICTASINGVDLYEAKYDDHHRQIETTNGNGGSRQYRYDDNGQMTEFIREDSSHYYMEYDEKGNMTSITNSMGGKVLYKYDSLNRVICTEDALGNCTEYSYDNNDELIEVRNAEGNVRKYSYDQCGNLISVEDYNGAMIQIQYNEMNKPVQYIDADGNQTRYEYDTTWNITKRIESNGGEVEFKYNNLHQIEQMIDANGAVNWLKYDPCGNIIERVDGEGAVYKIGYDELNRPNYIMDPCGRESHAIYDAFGNVTQITHPDQSTEEFRFDPEGKCVFHKERNGYEKYFEYTSLGQIKTVSDQGGWIQKYEYYPGGLLKCEMKNDGSHNLYQYDRNENIISITNQDGGKWEFRYNKTNRVKEVAQNGIAIERYEYDAVGNVIKIVDGEGNSKEYQYSLNNDLIEMTDGNGFKTCYEYDGNHQIVRILQPDMENPDPESINLFNHEQQKFRITMFDRDIMGNVKAVTDPEGNQETFAYDKCGRVTQKMDADGNQIWCEYYPDGAEKQFTFSDGGTVKMQYNDLCQLIVMEDWIGKTSIDRDAAGRPERIMDHDGAITEYKWGMRGERKSIKYPDGTQLKYEYDETSKLVSCDNGKSRVYYTYYDNGKIKEKRYPDQFCTKYGYNNIGNIAELQHCHGEKILDRFRYHYDNNGRKSVIEYMSDIGQKEEKYQYSYNPVGGLSAYSRNGETIEEYKYDCYGNRIQLLRKNETVRYAYNRINQLMSMSDSEGEHEFLYDKRGNLKKEIINGVTKLQLDFGSQGLLSRAQMNDATVLYEYNGFAKRIREEVQSSNGNQSKQITTYRWDFTKSFHDLIVEEKNEITSNIFWDTELLGIGDEHNTGFYMNNELMTPIRYFDSSGLLRWDQYNGPSASPFGNQNENGLLGFTGYIVDRTGYYYANQREYDYRTGRFISKDHFRGSAATPLTLNAYIYCLGDPINYTDPTGEIWAWLAGGIVGAVSNVTVKFAGDVVKSVVNGEWTMSSWESYAGAATGGFASGAVLVATGNRFLASGAGSAAEAFVTDGLSMMFHAKGYTAEDGYSWKNLMENTVESAATGLMSEFCFKDVGEYIKIPGITKGTGSYLSVWKGLMTKAMNGQIKNISMKSLLKGIVVYGVVQFPDQVIKGLVDEIETWGKTEIREWISKFIADPGMQLNDVIRYLYGITGGAQCAAA